MDTTLWINGQQNYQVQQNSTQDQQFWSQAGYSNTYPQYAEVNDSRSAQFNPGYGQQTAITYQQLTTNPGYSPLQNNYVNGNSNQNNAYDYAQTRNFPHQWQVSACQMTTQQDPTFPWNWSNQRPPKRTEQTETFPDQNKKNSVSNHNLMPLKFNYLPENVKTTVPHNRGGHRESNTESTSTFRWKPNATHGKQVEATRKKKDARKNQTQTPYTASTRMAPPRFTIPRKPMPPLDTFISNVQLPVSQTQMHRQSGAGAAPASSNSPVFRPPPPYSSHLSSVKNVQLPQASHLVNPNNPGRNPHPSYACQKAVAVVQPLSQKNTHVTAKKSCPERMGRQKDTLIAGCVHNIQIDGNTLPHLFQPLPECDGSEKDGSGSDQKHANKDIEPTDDGTVTTSLLPKGNVKESEAHQSVTLDSSHGKEIPKSGVQESETDVVGLLSVVPVRTWTHKQLSTLVEITTEVEMIKPCHSKGVVEQLIKCLWDNDPKKALSLIKTNYYKELLTGVIDFCKDTHDSTILSQVDSKDWHRVKEKCTVLEHDSVHFESPYVSPWLNVNRQLDDIDNEFGFPSSLKSGESKCNTETNPMETKCVIPVDIVKEMATKNVPLIAPSHDVVEAAKSILQTICTLSIVPDEALTVDLSDPLDLLEIETMHPDQARIVFEQLKNGSSLIEFKSNEFSTTEETTSMEEFCCLNRWIEKILGTEPLFECSCRSRSETNKPCIISTDDLDPSEEENIIGVSEVSLNPMRSNSTKGSKIIDLTKQFGVPQKGYDNTPITPPSTMDINKEEEIINDILRSIKGSSSTTALENNFNKELKPACTGETLNIEPKQPKDHDDDHTAVCANFPIAESSEDHTSTPKAILTIAQKQSNGDAHDLKSIGSHLTTGPTRLSPTVEPKDAGPPSLKMRLGLSRKRRRTIGKILQPFEEPVTSVYQPAIEDTSNDLIKEKVVADDSTTAEEKTVKLALFGSTEHGSGVSGPRGKSHSSSQWYSGLPHPPPSVVTLTNCSVRDRICEEWRNSYLPITIKNGKRRTIRLMDIIQNSNSATNAPVEAEFIDMERLPASPEQTFPLRSGKKRGRRKAHAKVLPLETTQMPNKSVTKKRLVNSRSKSKKPKGPDMRRKENRGLRLGLPRHHLEIKAGPRRRKDKRASVLDTSKGAAMNNGLKTTIQKSTAGWARIPDKKHGLLTSSIVSLQYKATFQESQKTIAKRKSLEYCD